MPPTKTTSKLGNLLGEEARRAAAEAKHKEFTPAGLELPPNVIGVARLRTIRIAPIAAGKKNAGKLLFYADGIVVSPEEYAGARTNISENLFATPEAKGDRARRSLGEHVAWVTNSLKGLGVPVSMLDVDSWEDAMAFLSKKRPHFRFATTPGQETRIEEQGDKFAVLSDGRLVASYPTREAAFKAAPYAGQKPRVFHNWNGVCAWSPAPRGGPMAAISVGEPATPTNRIASAIEASNGSDAVSEDDSAEEPAEESTEGPGGHDSDASESVDETAADLDGLLEAAEAGDQAAQEKLQEWAIEAGASQEDVDNASAWGEVVEMIRSSGGGGEIEESEAEPEPEEPDFEPVKGGHYGYKPMDPKTKKPGKTVVPCQVTAVNKAKSTVDLRSVKNPKMAYKAVPWDALIVE